VRDDTPPPAAPAPPPLRGGGTNVAFFRQRHRLLMSSSGLTRRSMPCGRKRNACGTVPRVRGALALPPMDSRLRGKERRRRGDPVARAVLLNRHGVDHRLKADDDGGGVVRRSLIRLEVPGSGCARPGTTGANKIHAVSRHRQPRHQTGDRRNPKSSCKTEGNRRGLQDVRRMCECTCHHCPKRLLL
jgi:hypothetical protein